MVRASSEELRKWVADECPYCGGEVEACSYLNSGGFIHCKNDDCHEMASLNQCDMMIASREEWPEK